jgi:5-methylcytosine-specific restriction endonuclease McrA
MIKIIDEVPHKYCTKCGEWKPTDEFHRCCSKKDGLYSYCKECRKLSDAAYYIANKSKINKYCKNWRTENKEWVREYKYNLNHTENGRIMKKNRDHRRRMQIEVTPERHRITVREWNQILYEYNNICPRCGCKFDDENPATMDHVKPLSKGGEHVYDNIQPLCHSCNSAKGVREIRYPVPDYHPKPDVDTFITI